MIPSSPDSVEYVDGPIGGVEDDGPGGSGPALRRVGIVAMVVSVLVAAMVAVLVVQGSRGPDAAASEGEKAAAQTLVTQVNSGHHHQPGPEHASMMADVEAMAAYQDAYVQDHPGKGAVPVDRTAGPVTVGEQVFEPSGTNEVTVLVPGEEKGLDPSVYCVVVANDTIGAPVAWDSMARAYADFMVMGGDPCGGAFEASPGAATP